MASTAFAAAKFLPATHLDSSPRFSPLRPAPTANLCFSPLSAASSSSLLRLRSPSPSGPGGKLPPPPRSYGGGGGSGDAADSGGDGRRGGILGLFLAGWAARVAADPQFPFKVLMEELVGVSACVLGDMASRPNFGLNELDFVFSTLVVGSILNFVLMYLLAPTAGVSAAASSHLLPESPRSSSSSSTPSPPPSTAPSSRRSRSSIRRCSRTSSCWGWYSTGSDVQDTDMLIHKALMDVNESPVYLLLNPAINHSQKDLPMTIYESELHVIDGSPQLIFVRSNYTIETVEAERISVDHVAHLKPSDGSSAATQLAAHLTGIHSAIKMLNSRVHVIHQYLVAMQRGDIPLDNSLLRQVSSLVRRLPAMESEKLLMVSRKNWHSAGNVGMCKEN